MKTVNGLSGYLKLGQQAYGRLGRHSWFGSGSPMSSFVLRRRAWGGCMFTYLTNEPADLVPRQFFA